MLSGTPVPVPSPVGPTGVTIPIGGPAAGSAAEADRFAREMLSQVRVPAGAVRVTSAPLLPQVAAATWPMPAADDAAVWRVPLPLDGAASFFARHPPGGSPRSPGASTDGVSDVINTLNYDSVLEFARAAVPTGIWGARVVLSMRSDGAGAALVRADAQVAWYPQRSRAEYIGGLHAMTITDPRGNTRTFTAPAVIARVAGLLNGLRASPTTVYDCAQPSASQGGYDVTFAVRRGAVPWTDVQVAPACVGVNVTTDEQSQPALADPGTAVASYIASLMRS
jgi:hypothetical protein